MTFCAAGRTALHLVLAPHPDAELPLQIHPCAQQGQADAGAPLDHTLDQRVVPLIDSDIAPGSLSESQDQGMQQTATTPSRRPQHEVRPAQLPEFASVDLQVFFRRLQDQLAHT